MQKNHFLSSEMGYKQEVSYKASLNLPFTDFPMKANLPVKEAEILKIWQEKNIYQKIRKNKKNKPKFILHDGPPYANGNIHVGHAVNKTLKDFIIKYKTLFGFDAPYVPGWDCHGLPIELNIEKKYGRVGDKISAKEFREKSRAYAQTQVEKQREDFKRLGVFGDWEKPYQTMGYSFEADVIRALSKIIERGHLHQGFKPVHWCVDCASSLAEAEVEYKEKTSNSLYVLFRVPESECKKLELISDSEEINKDILGSDNSPVFAVIWTTTPWTLPANKAIAVHPEIKYALVKIKFLEKEIYLILAEALIEKALSDLKTSVQIMTLFLGQSLEGLKAEHPFLENLSVPFIMGEHVVCDSGTGLVHTAPAHGVDDFNATRKLNISVESPLDGRGVFLPDTPIVGGCFYEKSNELIIQALLDRSRCLFTKKIQHSYPHCWRHKTPILFRATPQWFVSLSQKNLGKDALDSLPQISWDPVWGEERMRLMLEDRPDWCISRQRAWGTPIPLFVRKDNGQLHPETLDLLEIIAKKVEKQGVDAWFESEIADFLKPEEVDLYDRVLDTLDVWFDSGVTSFAVLERREDLAFPADIYLEGSDQYRGWFQTSLLTSIARSGQAPFRKIITHGFTVDEQGRKMSKSIGNVIEPQKVIEKLGADILRLWIASTEFRQEMSVSDEIFKRVSESYRRIRNTFRFLLANLHDFDLRKNKISLDQLVFLDRYILNKALILQKELMDLYEKNLFHLVVQKIHQFCSTDLGGFYLDIIKDRQYTCHQDNLARRSAQTVMHLILNAMVRWIAPILSFTAEEIWGYLRDKNLTLINNNSDEEESVFLTNWLEDLSLGEGAQTRENDLMLSDSGSVLLKLRDRVNLNIEEARNAGLIGAGLEAEVHIEAPRDIYFLLKKFEKELKFLFIVSNVDLKERIQEENCSGYASETGQNSSDFFIKITKSDYLKCDRCWHRVESVGQSQEHPSICNRCIENLSAPGEMRAYF